VLFKFKEFRKNRKMNLRTKIRILEAIVMKVVRYGSEARVLQTAEEDLLNIFQ